jgi:hypothetical protein
MHSFIEEERRFGEARKDASLGVSIGARETRKKETHEMTHLKRIGAIFAAAAMMAAVPVATAGAKITCTNPGGNAPAGQQNKCNGQALENLNPAGHAPPGQNT